MVSERKHGLPNLAFPPPSTDGRPSSSTSSTEVESQPFPFRQMTPPPNDTVKNDHCYAKLLQWMRSEEAQHSPPLLNLGLPITRIEDGTTQGVDRDSLPWRPFSLTPATSISLPSSEFDADAGVREIVRGAADTISSSYSYRAPVSEFIPRDTPIHSLWKDHKEEPLPSFPLVERGPIEPPHEFVDPRGIIVDPFPQPTSTVTDIKKRKRALDSPVNTQQSAQKRAKQSNEATNTEGATPDSSDEDKVRVPLYLTPDARNVLTKTRAARDYRCKPDSRSDPQASHCISDMARRGRVAHSPRNPPWPSLSERSCAQGV